jgi:hypothetical protein
LKAEQRQTMPDNNIHIDEKMADKGWQQMRLRLDKELPVARDRRRMIWMILFGLLAILVPFVIFTQKSNDRNSSPGKEKEAISEKEIYLAQRDHSVKELDSSNEATGAAHVSQESNVASAPVIQKDVLISKTDQLFQFEDAQGPITKNLTATKLPGINKASQKGISVVGVESEGTDSKIETYEGIKENVKNFDAEQISLKSKKGSIASGDNVESRRAGAYANMTFLANLPLHQVECFACERTLPELFAPIEPVKVRRRTLEVSLLAATHLDEPTRISGIQAGPVIKYRINKTWSLESGIQYGHYARNGLVSASNSEADLSNSGVESSFLSADLFANNLASYDTIQQLADKFNYLHFPIMVGYRVTRHLEIKLGTRISYLLNAPSNFGVVETFGAGGATSIVAEGNFKNNFLYQYDLLKKNDVAIVAGIDLLLARRLNLTMLYHHGLTPYIDKPAPSREDYHRSLMIGLKFRIF